MRELPLHHCCCTAAVPPLQLYPDSLAVTNSWAYDGDHDLAGIEVGADGGADGGLFTLHCRRDTKVRADW